MPTVQSARRLQNLVRAAINHRPPEPLWRQVRDFIASRRVPLCFLIFVALAVSQMALGHKPRSVINLHDPRSVAAGALVLGGLGLRSWAAGILCKNQVRANTGPYRFCRHPLYLGNLTVVAGLCILIAGTHAWVFLGPLAIWGCAIWHEEEYLAGRLESVRINHAAHAPDEVSLPTTRHEGWSLTQWWYNREYCPIGNALLALVALEAWRNWL